MRLNRWFRLLLFIVFPFAPLGAAPIPPQDAGAQVLDTTYVLRPNDVIRVIVYQEPELSVQIRILKTGQASFPLIGSVEVGGLSVSAAAEKIRELYARDYLVDPKLTLSVDEYATEFISVVGAFRSTGQIPIPVSGNMDLATAVATAGGLAETADVNSIQLVRASGTTTTLSMSAIQGEAGRIKLGAGDRLIANQSAFLRKTVTIMGMVGRPGAIAFPLDGRLDLVNAIALAGGLSELANPKKVSINRKGRVIVVDFKSLSQKGDRPFPLEPEDVVTVAERLF